ncbi:MAG: alpha/beta hydrolase-fold protein [Myxococcota bacterium]
MWTLLLIACSGPTPTPDPNDTDTDVDTDTDDTDVPPGGDAALVADLLAGVGEVGEVVQTVAWSGGWPVSDGTTYTFVYVASGDWSVAGDFNDWVPEPMDCSRGYCVAQVTIEGDPAGSKYKLTDGTAYVADPVARSYGYDEFGEVSYVRPPGDTWRLDRWPAAEGTSVDPRTLRVYVPPGAGPFRVLYAHDGQNLFDPAALWGGWRLQDALAASPMLVVGIDNTAARFDDYTHVADQLDALGPTPVGGNGDAYADFVHQVVRPHIEATYGSNGVDGQLGSSLGGLISLHVAHRFPGQYDFVASLSGTLGWGRFGDLGEAMETRWLTSDPGGVVYLSSGGGTGPDGVCADPDGDGFPEDDPDSSDNYCETRQMADALAAAGRTWDADLVHWHEPGAQHNEAAWAALVSQPLGIFAAIQP